MNVREILDRHNIDYVETGSNVAKGNVNVQCPWCGDSDTSQHLGINLASGMWGCWRNSKHRGRALSRLLVKLTGMSLSEARRIAGEGGARAIQQGDLERAVQVLTEGPSTDIEPDKPSNLIMPEYFRKICNPDSQFRWRSEREFRNYLISRKFPERNHRRLAKAFDLRYCVSGDFSGRLIIPVYEKGKLMTYLGRSIYKDAGLRYRALEKEDSVKQVKDCLYNFDGALNGGKVLVFVEGPLDVMKLDLYGRYKGVRAVGLFNMNLEEAQAELVLDLRGLFDRYLVMLDEGQVSHSLELQSALGSLLGEVDVRFMNEEGASDPGELEPAQVRNLAGLL